MGKLSKDRRDVYYRKAKEDGYRARSAYKLLHLDDTFGILTSLRLANEDSQFRAVDLCAAPGGWSQVISRRLWTDYAEKKKQREIQEPLIVAVDLQEMAPIDGVTILQGDITSQETARTILAQFKGQKAHLVVCDGAPDVTGMHDLDEYIQGQLLFAAARMATMLLKPGASFVAKIFRGESCGIQFSQLQVFFDDVCCCKPASSRISSYEAFAVCRGFKYPIGFEPFRFVDQLEFQGGQLVLCQITPSLDAVWSCVDRLRVAKKDSLEVETAEKDDSDICALLRLREANVKFLACGDLSGFDSDTTWPLEEGHQFLEPVQAPLNPPYKLALEIKRGIAKF